MADQRERRRANPQAGWDLGATGLPRSVWLAVALLLLALAIFLLAVGYLGYGGMIAVLAGAAAINLI